MSNTNTELQTTGNDVTRAAKLPTVAPAVDVLENEEEFLVLADMPGTSLDAIAIELDDDRLSLSADPAPVPTGRQLGGSRTARFERGFTVPRNVDRDGIRATYKKGVLSLHLPKLASARKRQIAVS